MWQGETVVRRCDSSQGCVKVVRNLFQLMGRYDGHGGDVRGCMKVKIRNTSEAVLGPQYTRWLLY